jgi:hypothetical protein
MLTNPAGYEKILRQQNSPTFLARFLPIRYYVSLLVFARDLWWMDQEWLELRWGRTTDQKIVAVHGTLCTIPPRNSNQQRYGSGRPMTQALVAGLSQRRSGLAPGSVHTGFVVDNVALGRVLLRVLRCPLSISFHRASPYSYIIWG